MSLSIGIVGLPNVGKSTLFNALLKKQIALAANYPFATIEPNTGIAEVPDKRLPVLSEIAKAAVIRPAVVEFTDIAGLVSGASQGEGLGNKFLSHIRETDAICHVLRSFSDENVIREGAVSPEEDLTTIRTELQLADLATLEKQRQPKGGVDKELFIRWDYVQKFLQTLNDGKMVITDIDSYGDRESAEKYAKELNLLTAKPEIFVINSDEDTLKEEIKKTKDWAEKLHTEEKQIVVVSAKIESEIAVLSTEDQLLYLEELGLQESGLERLAKVAYETLHLQSFLTAGEKEIRAWTIHQDMTAPQAAGVIHTDFEKHFITAKVVSYEDFVEHKGWAGVKEVGKIRQEGRDYVMQEGDVVEFMVGK
ncbi:MAG: redox-regulated ATPase YchF [Candidatus Pacebacteria bacterium]|jgi:ribosome-binding ATPase|nr:redox-regulated ATPase YchF [Candidatus Paceibacterota bacterium]MBT4652723.1 redox-regulated ATPase YchF [Candidatus Paceibacterota bacterium]MBT6755880.1 redox-regulated ATPase YchF [Candidatus Paceibacterota bacterium]MBT6921093.1 redox-regulated ATPase YchF [Candidatus Paceibacterota bacterium]